jgi:hypothetical protein
MQQKIKANKNLKEESSKDTEGVFLKTALELLADLPKRSQEIARKRFGFFSEKEETLEKIGKDYGITRERVRQIIADTNKKVIKKKNTLSFKKIENRIVFTIDEKFGIIKKAELIKELAGDDKKEANALMFLSLCSDKIFKVEDTEIKESLATKKNAVEDAKTLGRIAKEVLEKESRLLSDKEIIEKISKKSERSFSKEEVLSYLVVAKGIEKNNFGKWGISGWTEINPKGTREKIYTIFKEKKKPLHFLEITVIIDEYGLSKKKAHPQTIHNELIKNEKFVLIGRGIYALREWGYADGTVKDVLEEIFKKSGKSLTKDEVLQEVMKIRKVKRATILINLGNSKYFSKEKNLYFLKTKKHTQ